VLQSRVFRPPHSLVHSGVKATRSSLKSLIGVGVAIVSQDLDTVKILAQVSGDTLKVRLFLFGGHNLPTL